MRYQLRVSRAALSDISHVLRYTREHFGERKHDQYKALIRLTLNEISRSPEKGLAKHRPEIHADARTLHISRRGKRARHFFLYRVIGGDCVEIARLLHDSIEITRHLPSNWDSGTPSD